MGKQPKTNKREMKNNIGKIKHLKPIAQTSAPKIKKSAEKQLQSRDINSTCESTSSNSAGNTRPVAFQVPASNLPGGLSALQSKFAKKLVGARFRVINEKLYKSTGNDAFKDFQSDPTLFDAYHVGFREQAAQWPQNPLDDIISWILKNHKTAVIADMGCGDAKLASSVPNKVHSFDLVSRNDLVVAADIAHVPLKDASIDIVVFCLALMGVNIPDFILEAHRILKSCGILKIVEVRSRFEGESEGIKKFIRLLKRNGFDISSNVNAGNKMFFAMECVKSVCAVEKKMEFSAKPCLYKRR